MKNMKPTGTALLSRWGRCLLGSCLLVALASTQPSLPSKGDEPIGAGMVALLASPHTYEGKRVRTIGFLDIEFEGNALYLHEEDYRYSIYGNALRFHVSRSQEQRFKSLSLHYVLVEGTVYATEGQMYAGYIEDVSRLEAWPVYGRR